MFLLCHTLSRPSIYLLGKKKMKAFKFFTPHHYLVHARYFRFAIIYLNGKSEDDDDASMDLNLKKQFSFRERIEKKGYFSNGSATCQPSSMACLLFWAAHLLRVAGVSGSEDHQDLNKWRPWDTGWSGVDSHPPFNLNPYHLIAPNAGTQNRHLTPVQYVVWSAHWFRSITIS